MLGRCLCSINCRRGRAPSQLFYAAMPFYISAVSHLLIS
ncbi:MAG: hypothetical protein MRERV_53c012 [Mycoplasmataceae bacterium RV_VA103A]|nr:MAG: hypothetical protein MRERV_53c012 [Mycoplasmataceae bacterium RV_VA103A]